MRSSGAHDPSLTRPDFGRMAIRLEHGVSASDTTLATRNPVTCELMRLDVVAADERRHRWLRKIRYERIIVCGYR
jgi:hypothetical protein